jgi:hypothetical protein
MSLTVSSEQRFVRGYRRALLGLALGWRTIFLISFGVLNEVQWPVAMLMIYACGLAPYLALAGLASRIVHRRPLLTSGALLFSGDVLSGIGVLRPGSSTDAVAIFTYPLLATFVLVPITWFVSWLLNR